MRFIVVLGKIQMKEIEQKYIDKQIFVEVIYLNSDKSYKEGIQFQGIINKISEDLITIERSDNGEDFIIPFEEKRIMGVESGAVYESKTINKMIKNVDFIYSWTIVMPEENELKRLEDSEWLKLKYYCPTCKEILNETQKIDCNIIEYICSNKHSFYTERDQILTYFTMGEYRKLESTQKMKYEIFLDWLLNNKLRQHLNNALAEVIRILIKINNNNYDLSSNCIIQSSPYAFCPECSTVLQSVVSEDSYVSTLKCENNHKWFYRDGIWKDAMKYNLKKEMEKSFFLQCLKSWCSDPGYKEYVPFQLEELLHQEYLTFKNKIRENS